MAVLLQMPCIPGYAKESFRHRSFRPVVLQFWLCRFSLVPIFYFMARWKMLLGFILSVGVMDAMISYQAKLKGVKPAVSNHPLRQLFINK